MKKYIYPKVEFLESIHEKIIKIGLNGGEGGSFGYLGGRNRSDLESIIEFIQNDDYYPTFEDKLTHLVYAVNKNHIFMDGNKRSSIYFGAYFLELNSLEFLSTKFLTELENITVYVAENKISKDLLRKIISSLISEDRYSEELSLEILNAIS